MASKMFKKKNRLTKPEDTLYIEDLVHQDDWVCNSERVLCPVCTRNFHSFRRKHHCRRCGDVVCGNCTLYRNADLPVIGTTQVRVCLSCVVSDANKMSVSSPRTYAPTESSLSDDSQRWVANHVHSPAHTDNSLEFPDNQTEEQELAYPLDFDWENRWPKPPVIEGETERLKELHAYDILNTPKEKFYDDLCDLADCELNCEFTAIGFIDEKKQWFKSSRGFKMTELTRDVAFCAHTIGSKEPVCVLDTTKDKRFEFNPLVVGAAKIRFYASAPIVTAHGYVIGTIFVMDTRPRKSCDSAVLEQLSNIAQKNMELRRKTKMKEAREPVAVDKIAEDSKKPEAPQEQIVKKDENDNQLLEVQQKPVKNMENMLMSLLYQTTATQQQIANQNSEIHNTLGNHSAEINRLASSLARIEAKVNSKNGDS